MQSEFNYCFMFPNGDAITVTASEDLLLNVFFDNLTDAIKYTEQLSINHQLKIKIVNNRHHKDLF